MCVLDFEANAGIPYIVLVVVHRKGIARRSRRAENRWPGGIDARRVVDIEMDDRLRGKCIA